MNDTPFFIHFLYGNPVLVRAGNVSSAIILALACRITQGLDMTITRAEMSEGQKYVPVRVPATIKLLIERR
jgi:hypothetical protein